MKLAIWSVACLVNLSDSWILAWLVSLVDPASFTSLLGYLLTLYVTSGPQACLNGKGVRLRISSC